MSDRRLGLITILFQIVSPRPLLISLFLHSFSDLFLFEDRLLLVLNLIFQSLDCIVQLIDFGFQLDLSHLQLFKFIGVFLYALSHDIVDILPDVLELVLCSLSQQSSFIRLLCFDLQLLLQLSIQIDELFFRFL